MYRVLRFKAFLFSAYQKVKKPIHILGPTYEIMSKPDSGNCQVAGKDT